MILEWHQTFQAGEIAGMLFATAAVLLLFGPGLLLVHASAAGARGWRELASQGLALAAVLSLVWSLWGYSLAFAPSLGTRPRMDATNRGAVFTSFQTGIDLARTSVKEMSTEGRGGFVGRLDYALLNGFEPRGGDSGALLVPTRRPHYHLPHSVFFLFQLAVFVAWPAPLLVLLSRHYRGPAVLAFLVLWATLVVTPLTHWIWGDGYFGREGAVDFGGGLLHVGLGFSGLAYGLFLRRTTALEQTSPERPLALGAAVCWVGALLLHAGCAARPDTRAVTAFVNTHLAAAAGLVAAWAATRFFRGAAGPQAPAVGALAGLTAVASGCADIPAQSAVIIGVVGGTLAAVVHDGLASRPGAQPIAAVVSIHGAAALAGLLLTGLLATSSLAGQLWDGRPISGLVEGHTELLRIQAYAAVTAAAWAFVVTWLLLCGLSLVRSARREPVTA